MVDYASNEIIGEPLKVWEDFLSSDPDVPDDERESCPYIPFSDDVMGANPL